jgi:hypothetical protein
MKPITVYEANDGSQHATEHSARRRDTLIDDCRTATAILSPRPTTMEFDNGGGYVQQVPFSVRECKRQLMGVAKYLFGDRDGFWSQDPDAVHPMGIAGRLISDSSHKPLADAWYRLMCIDGRAREWGQPYYALNPEMGTQHEVAA